MAPIVSVTSLDKYFGRLHVLKKVNLDVQPKEVACLIGRSGSGKTNLTFVLMRGIMDAGIKVVAMDWKRGYRDLCPAHPDLRVYTIGRDVSPFRFNPLIPPTGCEPHVWIKLIVDAIAGASRPPHLVKLAAIGYDAVPADLAVRSLEFYQGRRRVVCGGIWNFDFGKHVASPTKICGECTIRLYRESRIC